MREGNDKENTEKNKTKKEKQNYIDDKTKEQK